MRKFEAGLSFGFKRSDIFNAFSKWRRFRKGIKMNKKKLGPGGRHCHCNRFVTKYHYFNQFYYVGTIEAKGLIYPLSGFKYFKLYLLRRVMKLKRRCV